MDLKSTRISHRRCSIKKMFLKILQNSPKSSSVGVSFLIKLDNLVKKRLFLRILRYFDKTFFTKHLCATASGQFLSQSFNEKGIFIRETRGERSRALPTMNANFVQCHFIYLSSSFCFLISTLTLPVTRNFLKRPTSTSFYENLNRGIELKSENWQLSASVFSFICKLYWKPLISLM